VESFIWEKIPWNLIEQNTSDWNKNETMQKLMLATEAGPAYLSWVPGFTSGFSRVRVTRSLALCVCFVDRCLSFCYFFFNNCPSYIYKLWLPLWYLQTLIDTNMAEHCIKNLEPRQNIDVTLLILFHLSRLTTRFLTSVILCGLLVGSVYPFRSLYLTPRFYFLYFYFCCCIPVAKSSVFSVVLCKSLSVFFCFLSLTSIFSSVKAIGTNS
jgi:hypothetical protein